MLRNQDSIRNISIVLIEGNKPYYPKTTSVDKTQML